MNTKPLITSIATLALITACNPELSPEYVNQLNNALTFVCPWVPLLKTQIPTSNSSAHSALLVAELSCPPNLPPTNLAAVIAMIGTVAVLRPWINRDIARGMHP